MCRSRRLPGKQVVNFMGDAAFGMVGLDVETAVRERIPITTIVMNNSTMGIYPDSRMPVAVAVAVAVERYNTKQLWGNFSGVAEALGAYSERITEPQEIIPAFRRAQEQNQAGRPVLLEFITKEEGVFSKFQFV